MLLDAVIVRLEFVEDARLAMYSIQMLQSAIYVMQVVHIVR